MKHEDINKIIDFMDNVTEDDDIDYENKVKGDVLEITINSFFDNKEIIYNFKIENDKIYFYSSNNRYEEATANVFLDEMLSQFYCYKKNL
tara:strand:+ start:9850 stop:10119 length:270 start_codon:yes stop_codon:yes gene_type:complete